MAISSNSQLQATADRLEALLPEDARSDFRKLMEDLREEARENALDDAARDQAMAANFNY